jgi:short subunit dehydrogenase-like uncharacterized protein
LTTPFLLYGSYGYTGSLIANLAVSRGMKPILAGRDLDRLKQQAGNLGLDYLHISLDDPTSLRVALERVPLVLNCAGPFAHTYRPVVEACLRLGKHYLDITGEIKVFESLAALDARAREAGIMLLPGLGLDVVPSDCLAVHLKQRLPGATQLTLAISGTGGGISRGTALTSIEGISGQGVVRRDGKLVPVPLLGKTRQVDFGRGPRLVANIPWGDVSTAYYSTGIPNIETYMALPKSAMRMVNVFRPIIGLGRKRWMQRLLKWAVMKRSPGPSDEILLHGRSRFWGQAIDEQGNQVTSRLETLNGYALTAETALAAVRRILAGDFKPGFQTPALAYGADFILEVDGSHREDIV